MKFIRLFPDTIPLVLTLLMGLSLLLWSTFKSGNPTLKTHKGWVAFNGVLIVMLLERLFRPGVQLTLNFVVPGLLSLVWLMRLVDLELGTREKVYSRILLKLPFLMALIIMTITNHIGELYGLIGLCVAFVVIQILTYKEGSVRVWKISADVALILTFVLSYTFGELRNYFWYLTLFFQLGMFLDTRDGSAIEN